MTIVCKTCSEKRAHRDAIIYEDYAVCASCFTYYEIKNGKRSSKSLNACDVFTVRVKNPEQLHYAYTEWCRALELGKVLVLIYDIDYIFHDWETMDNERFKFMMRESKKSFKKLSDEMRDAIIRKQPNFDVENYKLYKQYLKDYRSMQKY